MAPPFIPFAFHRRHITYVEKSRYGPSHPRQLHAASKSPVKHVRSRTINLTSLNHPLHQIRIASERDLQPASQHGLHVVNGHHLAICATRLLGGRVECLSDPVCIFRDVADVCKIGLEEVRQHILLA